MTLIKLSIPILVCIALSACATQYAPDAKELTAAEFATARNHINIVINTKRPGTNAKGEPLICKESQKTGTRLRPQVSCHTKAEWDYIKSKTQENIKNMYLKSGSDHG